MQLSPARVAAALCTLMAATATLGMTAAPITRRSPSASAQRSPARVVLLYTGEQRGYLEPCGCTKPQIGGLPRRASLLASLSGSGKGPLALHGKKLYEPAPATIVVDNGDMVEDPGRQSQLKAETLAGFYRANRYAAINLGECDYRLGFGYLRALQATARTPFLSANVRLGERPAFGETASVAGVTLVGVLAGSFAAEVRRWNPILRVEMPEVTMARLEPSLRKAERVVLLFHGTPEEARPLARRFPWLTAIITAHEADDYRPHPLFEGRVPLVNAGRKGKVVGRLELMHAGARQLAPIALGPQWGDAVPARTLLNRYLSRVNDEGLLERLPRLPASDSRRFAGTAHCQSCHADAHHTWQQSAHARAYQTLVAAGHDRDPDCVGCHVVGLGMESGFRSLASTPHLKDVGCESCHGGGAAHAQSPTEHPMPRTAAQACSTCHVAEHSPDFDFARFWAKIRH